jgi:hypothetical protein
MKEFTQAVNRKNSALREGAEFDLVKGDYSKEEASDILLSLLNYKINFHELRCFRHEIQTGETNAQSVKRLEELKADSETIMSLLSSVQKGKFRIKSVLQIELID